MVSVDCDLQQTKYCRRTIIFNRMMLNSNYGNYWYYLQFPTV